MSVRAVVALHRSTTLPLPPHRIALLTRLPSPEHPAARDSGGTQQRRRPGARRGACHRGHPGHGQGAVTLEPDDVGAEEAHRHVAPPAAVMSAEGEGRVMCIMTVLAVAHTLDSEHLTSGYRK